MMTTNDKIDAILGKHEAEAWLNANNGSVITKEHAAYLKEHYPRHEVVHTTGLLSTETVRAMLAEARTEKAQEPETTGGNPPFSNCSFQICDLPGQCRGEGACHHPKTGDRAEKAQEPVATLLEPHRTDCFRVSAEDAKRLRDMPAGTHLYTISPTIEAAEQAAAVKMRESSAKSVGDAFLRFKSSFLCNLTANEIRALPLETGALRELLWRMGSLIVQDMDTGSGVFSPGGKGVLSDDDLTAYVDRIIAGKGEGK